MNNTIFHPVTYRSSHATSDSVLLLALAPGTGYMIHQSEWNSATGVHQSSFDDIRGIRTPRSLTMDDFKVLGNMFLALDLNTGQTIDFFSALNWYYGTGMENLPVITVNP